MEILWKIGKIWKNPTKFWPNQSLKKYGKIKFVRDSRCRAITGYGTIGNQSMWQSFVQHVKIQSRGLSRIFFKKDHYEDCDDNLVKNK